MGIHVLPTVKRAEINVCMQKVSKTFHSQKPSRNNDGVCKMRLTLLALCATSCRGMTFRSFSPSFRTLKVGVWQGTSHLGDVAENLLTLERAASVCEQQGVELLVLPELFLHGYGCTGAQLGAYALNKFSNELKRAGELARRHSVWILLPYAERASRVNNSAVVFDVYNSVAFFDPSDGRLAHQYRKVHLAGLAESSLYHRGAPEDLEPFTLVTASGTGVSIGVAVCYDLEFPEHARTLAMRGAEVLVAPSAVGPKATTQSFCSARAMENLLYVVNANAEGEASFPLNFAQFAGSSAVYAPDGKVLAQIAQSTGGSLLTATLELKEQHSVVRGFYFAERQALRDRGYYAESWDRGNITVLRTRFDRGEKTFW